MQGSSRSPVSPESCGPSGGGVGNRRGSEKGDRRYDQSGLFPCGAFCKRRSQSSVCRVCTSWHEAGRRFRGTTGFRAGTLANGKCKDQQLCPGEKKSFGPSGTPRRLEVGSGKTGGGCEPGRTAECEFQSLLPDESGSSEFFESSCGSAGMSAAGDGFQ